MVDNTKRESLPPCYEKKITPGSVVYTDRMSSYDVLAVSGFHHPRINHGKQFTNWRNHINSIENFWNPTKRVLRKYNGIDQKSLLLFLKECEFRFNFGVPKQQLKILQWEKVGLFTSQIENEACKTSKGVSPFRLLCGLTVL